MEVIGLFTIAGAFSGGRFLAAFFMWWFRDLHVFEFVGRNVVIHCIRMRREMKK